MLKKPDLKTIVVKVGTKVLTGRGYHLDRAAMKNLVGQVSAVVKKGVRVVIVSSGAIVSGAGLLKFSQRPKDLSRLQACAAVGQPHLMRAYDELFRPHGIITSQILLTREDLSDRKRYLNAKATIETLLDQGVVPIVNENDTVSVEEIKFGDNDKLASLVANQLEADLLILLSDVDGLYRYVGGKKEVVRVVRGISAEIESLARSSRDELGTGGMSSKIQAAKIAIGSGIPCVIANGKKKNTLLDIMDGCPAATIFLASADKPAASRRWLLHKNHLCHIYNGAAS
ncbi:MAG: glutamate 5-kinase [Candidatus Omnitrophica bacterium]|nr:glutamate 5-kinase [Candidatus Omnitrophota bacterium]